MTWYVYALIDPRDNAIRYVGKSSNPARRLQSHRSRSAAKAMREWILGLETDPLLKILDQCDGTETEALLLEQGWIARVRASGASLLNAPPSPQTTRPLRVEFSGLGKRVSARRKALGMSSCSLADVLGLDRGNLSRIENGHRPKVSAEVAVLLARALGTTVEWLVTGEEIAAIKVG